jgi:sec-independent protein translocase protein TatC
VSICEVFVIPKAIEALLWFNEWLGLQPDLRLTEWLGFAILMPLVFGISFQTPLVMLFLERIGVFSVPMYREKRKMAIILIAIFSAVITPTTDAISMGLLAVPMYLLYELGIILIVMQPRSEFEEMEMAESEEMVEV